MSDCPMTASELRKFLMMGVYNPNYDREKDKVNKLADCLESEQKESEKQIESDNEYMKKLHTAKETLKGIKDVFNDKHIVRNDSEELELIKSMVNRYDRLINGNTTWDDIF